MSAPVRRRIRPLLLERLESLDLPSNLVSMREATGADAAAIQSAVTAFRTDLGGLNPNVPGSLGTGRREVNWDGVPDASAAPNDLPANYFNTGLPAGFVLSSPGASTFRVSAAANNPTGAAVRFGELNSSYPFTFSAMSGDRLFVTPGSTVTDVTFFIPGTTTPAAVRGFGAVFSDVDTFGAAKLEFFDAAGRLFFTRTVLPTAGNGTFSFLGVSFDAADIARVRITAGTAPLGAPDVTLGGVTDVVAMDDFIFGEPNPPPPGGTVTGTVFVDTNVNGIFDVGERGLAGSTVFADANSNGKLDPDEPSTVTGASGTYALGVPASGSMMIYVKLPNGYSATTAIAYAEQIQSGAITSDVNFGARVTPVFATPIAAVAAGPGAQSPQVIVFNGDGSVRARFDAFPGFVGGVHVATGDVTGDGQADVIAAAGAGGGPHVRVFDGVSGALVREFYAYSAAFRGGVFVAAGDMNGDGRAEIITGAGAGGGPHVRVFDGATGAELAGFFAFDSAFMGGVTVAAGDVTGDSRSDLIVAAGPGGGPHVKVFDGQGLGMGGGGAQLALANPVASRFVFPADFRGGVFVAAADFDGDLHDDIVVGTGLGASFVRVLSGVNGSELGSLPAFGSFPGGVRVAARDLTGDGLAELIVGAGAGGAPHVRVIDASTQTDIHSFFAFDPSFLGGVFVG